MTPSATSSAGAVAQWRSASNSVDRNIRRREIENPAGAARRVFLLPQRIAESPAR
jgi:hypothetical protein